LQQLERVLGQPDLVLDLETGPGGRCFGPGHDSQDLFGLSRLITGETSYQSPTVLPNSRKSLDSSQDTPSLVVNIGDFISHLGFPYPWLLLEFLTVYIARLFIDGYTWTYRGNLEVEDEDKTAILPREKFIFEVSPLETVSAGVARLRSEVEEFETRITRFLDVLPAGKIPVKRISSLEEYTTWLYRNKIRGESIKSISKKVFPGEDDRRKDIYDGIERASHLLTLGA